MAGTLYGGGDFGSDARGPLTDGAWLPAGRVLAHLSVPTGAQPQTDDADAARLAAAAYVERHRPDLLAETEPGVFAFLASPDVLHGAVLLTARLYARKGSPTGLASYGEFGPAALPRLDPDIERLLGLGRYGKPAVG